MSHACTGDGRNVFINCPFTSDFRPLFEAALFTIIACGFNPRTALEAADGSEVRIDKIVRIAGESRYSIHDLSAVAIDTATGLPRFNMPFELGLVIGLKRSGVAKYRGHSLLVLEHTKYSYQKCLSDIAGQDTHAHGGEVANLIPTIRNWLSIEAASDVRRGGATIARQYAQFKRRMPGLCREAGIRRKDLSYLDLVQLMRTWLAEAASVDERIINLAMKKLLEFRR